MASKTYYPIGEISSGTLRIEDLLPTFSSELEDLAKNKRTPVTNEKRAADLRLCAKTDAIEDYASDDAADLLRDIEDALNEYAAPYFYFGSSEGDGASFGFYLSPYAFDDFDGLKVSDLSEVPADFRGEVLHVNDHGNTSLYYRDNTSDDLQAVWEIV